MKPGRIVRGFLIIAVAAASFWDLVAWAQTGTANLGGAVRDDSGKSFARHYSISHKH